MSKGVENASFHSVGHDHSYDEISALNNQLVNMQRELAKKNAELEKANRIKNQFLGMVVHDMRNPLSVILAYSKFLLNHEQSITEEKAQSFLEIIRSSADYMLNMVDELLNISEIEAGKLKLDFEQTDILTMVQHSILVNKMLAKDKQIDILCDTKTDLPEIPVDKQRVLKVLNNLIGNAVKFSNPLSHVEVQIYLEGDYLVIAVIDSGLGIPPHEVGNLFTPFGKTSTKSTHGEKNTGLGLAIAKKIVDGHNGFIKVQSEPGVGSRFFVYLPIINPNFVAAEVPQNILQEYTAAAGEQLKILIVDDEEVNRMAVEVLVEELGHYSVRASSGREALQVLDKESIDIVVMDIEMPDMNGMMASQLIRELDKKRNRHTYVIGLSAHPAHVCSGDCLKAGMDDYITKPLEIETLCRAIQKSAKQQVQAYESTEKKHEKDEAFHKLLVSTFENDYPRRKAELKKAIEIEDDKVVRSISHTLKSSLSYIGAYKASALASQLENGAVNIQSITELYNKMVLEIEMFLKRFYAGDKQ